MTIEDGPLRSRGARPTAHELRRYEGLFAARTRGMRSSAMRDMMALTERPEVISLAGGLPDTSTFPPELYAKLMAHVAADSTARALQYGPTEGMAATMDCIVEVMAAEDTFVAPEDMIVTTGGQQVIDLVCKTLIDPGDVIVAEAPTYPGAVPDLLRLRGGRRADRDGRRRHAHRRARGDARPPASRGPAAEVHLHDPQLPEPGRRDDVAGAPPPARRDRARARAARARGQPLRAAPLRGRRRCRRCTRSTPPPPAGAARRTSSSTWAPSRRSSRPACAWAGRSRRGRCSRSSTSASRAPTSAPRR